MNFIKKAGEAVNSNVLNLEGSMSVWTVVWSLPQLGAGICPALPPILWLRHDRSDPESVIVMFNDEVLWARRGDALQASRQPGSGSTYQHSDRFGRSSRYPCPQRSSRVGWGAWRLARSCATSCS
jgi:hypothetical protein